MKKFLPVFLLLLFSLAGAVAVLAQAEPGQRWLHVRVEKSGEEGESVRINLPLKVALKVLPAIEARELQGGRLKIHEARIHGVDIRSLLEAIKTLDDGEFLTVESEKENVRVAKQAGNLLVKVDDRQGDAERVDVKVPLRVVEALLSGEEDELNLLAAVEALSEHGDDVLVTVESARETVRVWVDSKSSME